MLEWAANLLPKMKMNGIGWKDIAAKLGWSVQYVSAVVHGRENPKEGRNKVEAAVNDLTGGM